mmetsp:Transcript_24709/g.44628  ORF Transcript_24709/g.44628 Transcript_24709/m.44628 type:complete len:165 (-) Transcript_24709:465-959(-)
MMAYLEAHEGATYKYNRYKNMLEMTGHRADPHYQMHGATPTSHHLFVCGDLNCRYHTLTFGDKNRCDHTNFGDSEDSTSKDKKKSKWDKMKRGISKATLSTRKLKSSSHLNNNKLDGSNGNDVADTDWLILLTLSHSNPKLKDTMVAADIVLLSYPSVQQHQHA